MVITVAPTLALPVVVVVVPPVLLELLLPPVVASPSTTLSTSATFDWTVMVLFEFERSVELFEPEPLPEFVRSTLPAVFDGAVLVLVLATVPAAMVVVESPVVRVLSPTPDPVEGDGVGDGCDAAAGLLLGVGDGD